MLEKVLKIKFLFALGVLLLLPKLASAQLIESWENTLDGWQVPPSYNLQPTFGAVTGFSTTNGVTDGTYSLSITGTGGNGPNYSQLMHSPSTTALTTILANASAIKMDVFAPANSFGGFLQWDFDINNADTGFTSLDGFSYASANLGSETTFTIPIPAGVHTTLSTSANPTEIDIQVGGGFTAGNETVYVDNLRAVPVPEPVSALIGGLGLLTLRRRRTASV